MTISVEVAPRGTRCPFCHDVVVPADEKAACDECMAWHHLECWEEALACSGCRSRRPPLLSQRRALESGPRVVELQREGRARRVSLPWQSAWRAAREAILAGLPARAQELCRELASQDEDMARALYEQLQDETRDDPRLDTTRRGHRRVFAALAASNHAHARRICRELSSGDREAAGRLYSSLLARARARGIVP